MSAQSPQRFGRYVLLDRMGTGGMAEVFRAVVPGAEGFRRDLVVKRILADRARAANFIEMFVHEARISALLHHPNVVQVFDFGQVDGSYFLAMELLRGRDLLAIFRALRERQRPFPVPVAAHVAHQVALGLGYAHALTSPEGQPLNIIHRDVSPSNIMCLRTGGVKLLDFGIAQAIGEMDSDESDRSSFKGKLSYMAPERLRDEPQDGRVDLFALGAVLWEMLAGRRLFAGKTDIEKLRSVLDKPIPPPSTLRPEVPPELDRIVLKALSRDPETRYASGQDMADDLEVVVGELKYHSRMLPALLVDLFGSAPSSTHIALSMVPPDMLAFDPIVTPPSTTALPAEVSTVLAPISPPARAVGLAGWAQRWGGLRLSGKVAVTAAALGVIVTAGVVATPAPSVEVRPSRTLQSTGMTLEAATIPKLGEPSAGVAPVPAPTAAVPPTVVPVVAASDEPAKVTTTTATATAPTATAVTKAAAPAPAGAGTTGAAVPAVAGSASRGAARSTAPVRKPARPAVRPVVKKSPSDAAGRIARGLSIDPFAEAAPRGSAR